MKKTISHFTIMEESATEKIVKLVSDVLAGRLNYRRISDGITVNFMMNDPVGKRNSTGAIYTKE